MRLMEEYRETLVFAIFSPKVNLKQTLPGGESDFDLAQVSERVHGFERVRTITFHWTDCICLYRERGTWH